MAKIDDLASLAAAQTGDPEAFARLTEPYRRELLVHCYRMLGSVQEAEDLVQETMLRAWRRLDSFERHVSFRAWLYKIATNACLDALDRRRRRTLPARASPASDPRSLFAPPATETAWLEPLADEWLDEAAAGPEAHYSLHESVSLAFLVALQVLPPRQRVVLLMRDVLDFSASETAGILELTVSSVNSALNRARVTLARHYHANGREAARGLRRAPPVRDAVPAQLQAQLDQYVLAWETEDVARLIGLLKEDAALSMPPSPSWYRGREAIGAFLETFPFSSGARGRWQLRPAQFNGQPAFQLYLHDLATDQYRTIGLQVLTFAEAQIAEITVFLQPEFFAQFGFGNQGR